MSEAAVNPVVWREKRHTTSRGLSAMMLLNGGAALALLVLMYGRLMAYTPTLLPTWGWWSMAALMAGTAYAAVTRIRLERSRGTLELLRSTPLVLRALLDAQVRMGLGWLKRALPLWAVWLLWAVAAGPEQMGPRLLVLVPIIALMTVAGTLLGVRLGLAPQGSNWGALGGVLGFIVLILFPAGLDAMAGQIQVLSDAAGVHGSGVCLPSPGYGPMNALGDGGIVMLLTIAIVWLWNADLRALSGFELQESGRGLEQRMKVHPLWQGFDGFLLMAARAAGLDKNPFFMRERARSLRKLGRTPALVLTAIVPTLVPLCLEKVLSMSAGLALAWSAIPLIFLWWMAGAECTRDALTRELDGRTLDTVRVAPMDPKVALMGLVFGRLYPFVVGWLISLPLWALYTLQGVSVAALGTFTLVLLGIGFCSAVGGLRASCTSLELKGEDRYYSQAVGNPALWAWPLATPLIVLFLVLPFHGVLEAMGLVSRYTSWVPLDVVSLFPTWFSNPELLPVPTFLVAVGVHAVVMRNALKTDLTVAWESVQAAMNEDLRKPGAAVQEDFMAELEASLRSEQGVHPSVNRVGSHR